MLRCSPMERNVVISHLLPTKIPPAEKTAGGILLFLNRMLRLPDFRKGAAQYRSTQPVMRGAGINHMRRKISRLPGVREA